MEEVEPRFKQVVMQVWSEGESKFDMDRMKTISK